MDLLNNRFLLPRRTPESVGIHSGDLSRFFQVLDDSEIQFHHITVIRHGAVAAQGSWAPYDIEEPHMTHSLTKLFTNTAVGIACDNKLVSLEDTVVSFFPEDLPLVENVRLNKMRVRDLITMRCGHDHLISGNKWRPIKTSWIAEFFKEPLAYEPGEHFQYTSATSYILSAIVQKVCGCTTFEYLKRELLDDLNISDMTWDLSPQGICSGGNGITVKNEDAAKLGLLYLNDGCLNGKRYLSHKWIREAMYDSCLLNPDTGYGFHLSNEDGIISSGGIFGQTIVIIPKYDVVLSINAANQDNRPNALDISMRKLIAENLVPFLQEGSLKEYPEELQQLRKCLNSLQLESFSKDLAEKSANSRAASFNGKYRAADNEDGISSLGFHFSDSDCTFTMTDHRGTHTIVCKNGAWAASQSSMTGYYLHHQYQPESANVKAVGWWEDAATYVMKWVWCNMTFVDSVVCRFDNNTVGFIRSVNVNTQSKIRPEIVCSKM